MKAWNREELLIAVGLVATLMDGDAQTVDAITLLPSGEVGIAYESPEFPRWTGSPAVKTLRLLGSSDLKNWELVGQDAALKQGDPLNPLNPLGAFQFTLEPGGESRFFRIEENLSFQFVNTESSESPSYGTQFDVFLEQSPKLTVPEFRDLFSPLGTTRSSAPVEPFLETLSFDPTTAPYWDAFNTTPDEHNVGLPADDPERRRHNFKLNAGELALFKKNGFVVSERLQYDTFVDLFYDIWSDDLPVFVSTDAILQAWHRSYLAMLEETEEVFLRPSLQDLLDKMSTSMVPVIEGHGGGPLRQCLIDIDLFLTVARSLIRTEVQTPLFPESATEVASFFNHALASSKIVDTELFGESGRLTDFTQFRVRGHYENSLTLARYFQTMMWLGRIDFRMGGGSHATGTIRQLCAAAVLSLLLEESGRLPQWRNIEQTINAFVGLADFMTPEQMLSLLESENMKSWDALAVPGALTALQERIVSGHHGEQEIFSSIIVQGCSPDSPIILPRALAFFGQKFTPDSWVLSKVTFDRIWKDGKAVERRMPSGLDVVFAALGNDHVSGILADRMENKAGVPFRDGYEYQENLAAVRRTLDAQEPAFWESNVYQGWLGSLRALSAGTRGAEFPEAMRTRAWAMKTVNTQLASWTQLRHDTVLYAKQSVTPPSVCFYPAGYVEPRIEFWDGVSRLAEITHKAVGEMADFGDGKVEAVRVDAFYLDFLPPEPNSILDLPADWYSTTQVDQSTCRSKLLTHLEHFRSVTDHLGAIARAELRGEPMSDDDLVFIRDLVELVSEDAYTGIRNYSGWYPAIYYRNAFYGDWDDPSDYWDPLVTDVHTDAPDDFCTGDPGGFLQEAVGNVHFLLMATDHGESGCVVGGPVFSHYEFVSPFSSGRMTDSIWKNKVFGNKWGVTELPPVDDHAREFLAPQE